MSGVTGIVYFCDCGMDSGLCYFFLRDVRVLFICVARGVDGVFFFSFPGLCRCMFIFFPGI